VKSEEGRPFANTLGVGSLGLQRLFTFHFSLFTLFLVACGGISPLRGHAVVGRDAYLVLVGDGPAGQADLFAVRADGGPVFPLTYSSVPERAPALSPNGGTVAFLRGHTPADPHPGAVWVLNLLSGGERELQLPREAPPADQVGWSADGRSLYVRAGRLTYRLAAPPALPTPRPVSGREWFTAESSFAVLLGEPVFARVLPCAGELCVQDRSGVPAPLAPGARAAVRWGPDSVAYLLGQDLIVRPVGPGHARAVQWSGAPGRARDLTFFPGKDVNTR
jgi:hypothetical protein